MTLKHYIAYVVPTKDRPEDLEKLLQSLAVQARAPDQIIIVDGGDQTVEGLVQRFSTLPIDYVREYPPSLARQRNAGMARLRPEITVAGFLDDDLVLEPDATAAIAAFWQNAAKDIGGAAFSIVNQPRAFANRLARLFLIDDPRPGRLLASGFQSQIPPLAELTETDWLYGGATTWLRQVITDFAYDEWYLGHGYLEDVDFSYRVRQKYRLFVVGAARVYHYPRPIRTDRQFDLGRQQILNRLYFIRNVGGFRRRAIARAMLGQIIVNFASSIRRGNGDGFRRCGGNLIGILQAVVSSTERIGGYYK